MLASPSGDSQAVSAEALRSLFAVFKDSVQLVLLNACYSDRQAKAISEVVPYVIGMNAPISDGGATMFASSFYAALSFDKNIEEAFDQGRVALMLDGVDREVPVLVKS